MPSKLGRAHCETLPRAKRLSPAASCRGFPGLPCLCPKVAAARRELRSPAVAQARSSRFEVSLKIIGPFLKRRASVLKELHERFRLILSDKADEQRQVLVFHYGISADEAVLLPQPIQFLRLCVVEEQSDQRFVFAMKRLQADNFIERDDVRITDVRWEELPKLREPGQEWRGVNSSKVQIRVLSEVRCL